MLDICKHDLDIILAPEQVLGILTCTYGTDIVSYVSCGNCRKIYPSLREVDISPNGS